MRYLLPLAFVIGCAAPVEAQSALRTATEAFATAAAADWASTRALLKRGGIEKNPMYRWAQREPDALVALGASVDVLGVWAWNKTVGRRRPKLAVIGLYAMTGVRIWLTGRNLQTHQPRQLQPWGGPPPNWGAPIRNPRMISPGRS